MLGRWTWSGSLAAVVQPEAHLDDPFLARRQRLEHGRHLFLQVQGDHRIGRGNDVLVLDQFGQHGYMCTQQSVGRELRQCTGPERANMKNGRAHRFEYGFCA